MNTRRKETVEVFYSSVNVSSKDIQIKSSQEDETNELLFILKMSCRVQL